MNTVALVDKRLLWGHVVCAIYQVGTAKSGTVYMRADRSNMNDRRAVVIVDSGRFLAACRAFPGHQEPAFHGDESVWRADYKFDHAAGGFAHGIGNPVPLAKIGVHLPKSVEGRTSVAFTNGITRTLWLLANGAAAFPVECSVGEAAALHAAAGVRAFPVCTVEQLLGFMDWSYFMDHQLAF